MPIPADWHRCSDSAAETLRRCQYADTLCRGETLLTRWESVLAAHFDAGELTAWLRLGFGEHVGQRRGPKDGLDRRHRGVELRMHRTQFDTMCRQPDRAFRNALYRIDRIDDVEDRQLCRYLWRVKRHPRHRVAWRPRHPASVPAEPSPGRAVGSALPRRSGWSSTDSGTARPAARSPARRIRPFEKTSARSSFSNQSQNSSERVPRPGNSVAETRIGIGS